MAPRAPADLTTDELKALIANHKKQGATSGQRYIDALSELERRLGQGLNFETSFRHIHAAAREKKFLSYKQLADASGCDWAKVHYSVGGHLWALIDFAHAKKWPMLSAIVTNQKNVETGNMDPDTLKGFTHAAEALGYPVTDDDGFLKEQQQAVFEWAALHPDAEVLLPR